MIATSRARFINIPLLSLAITVFESDGVCFSSLEMFVFSYLITTFVTALIWTGNVYIFDHFHKKYPSLEQTVRRTVFLIIFSVVFTLSAYTILELSLSQVLSRELRIVSYYTGLKVSFIATTIVTLAFEAHFFFVKWKHTALDMEKFRRESLQAQLESLRNQVNPHFLFNSLNTLMTIIPEEPALAMEFTGKLSDVYRYLLSTKDRELVELCTELEFISSYLFLLKVRFEESILVEQEIPEEVKDKLVPPVSLQLLIENAIKHNVVSRNSPLHLRIRATEDYVSVTNNIKPKIDREPSTGTGLENIRKRYNILSGKNIEVIKTDDFFEVKLPLLEVNQP